MAGHPERPSWRERSQPRGRRRGMTTKRRMDFLVGELGRRIRWIDLLSQSRARRAAAPATTHLQPFPLCGSKP